MGQLILQIYTGKKIQNQLKKLSDAQAKANFAVTGMRGYFSPCREDRHKKCTELWQTKRENPVKSGTVILMVLNRETEAFCRRWRAIPHSHSSSHRPPSSAEPSAPSPAQLCRVHANVPSKPSPFAVSWESSVGNNLSPFSRTVFWLGLQQIVTEVQTSWVLMVFWENNVGFVEEENLHHFAFQMSLNFL